MVDPQGRIHRIDQGLEPDHARSGAARPPSWQRSKRIGDCRGLPSESKRQRRRRVPHNITHAHIAVHGYLQHVNDEEEGDEADTARGIMSGIIDGSLGRICTNSVFAHIA